MLSGAFFMLQVYDRVLPSRSVATLVALAILVAGLFLIHALLDTIRRRVLMRIGTTLDDALSGRIYHSVVRLPSDFCESGRRTSANAGHRLNSNLSVEPRSDSSV